MTNTEKIRQEIERRIGAMYNFSSGYSALNVCRELLDFIDSLPKESEKGMKWRTDKPTANVIVVNHTDTGIYDILHRIEGKYYLYTMFGAKEIPIDEIKKWADLEEDETVTNCHQLEEAAEGTIDSVSYEGIGDRTLIAVAMTHEELRKLGEYHIDSVVHIRKAN